MRDVVLASGLAGGLALSAQGASAQTLFAWASPIDGVWSDAMNWGPAGVPGASALDSVVLGRVGAYVVDADLSISVDAIQISNPDAVLSIGPRTLLTATSVFGLGSARITADTTAAGRLQLLPGSRLGSDVELLGAQVSSPDVRRPKLFGSTVNELPVIIQESVRVSGSGQLHLRFHNDGLIETGGDGSEVRFLETDQITQGPHGVLAARNGGLLHFESGVRVSGGRVEADSGSALGGLFRVGDTTLLIQDQASVSGGTLEVESTAVIENDGLLLDDTRGVVRLRLMPASAFDGPVRLVNNRGDRDFVQIEGSAFVQFPSVFRENTVLTGSGFMKGHFINLGTIGPSMPGDILELELGYLYQQSNGAFEVGSDATVFGFGLASIHGGTVRFYEGSFLAGRLEVHDARVIGQPRPAPAGAGLTSTRRLEFHGDCDFTDLPTLQVINAQGEYLRFSFYDGAVFPGTILLSRPDDPRNGGSVYFEGARLGPTGRITGSGTLSGSVGNLGVIEVLSPDHRIETARDSRVSSTGDGLIRGGFGGQFVGNASGMIEAVQDSTFVVGGEFRNATMRGTFTIDPEGLLLDRGSYQDAEFIVEPWPAGSLDLKERVEFDGSIVLMGVPGVSIAGFSAPGGGDAVLTPGSVVSGHGSIGAGVNFLRGTLIPGPALGSRLTISNFRILVGQPPFAGLTPTAVTIIHIAGVLPDQHTSLALSGNDIALDGTVRVVADEPRACA